MVLKFSVQEREGVTNEVAEVQRRALFVSVLETPSDVPDYIAGTMPVTHDALQDRPSLFDIQRLVCKPAQTGVAVCDDGCQRLVDLMSDGRCHLAHGHHLRDAREISPRRAQRFLG